MKILPAVNCHAQSQIQNTQNNKKQDVSFGMIKVQSVNVAKIFNEEVGCKSVKSFFTDLPEIASKFTCVPVQNFLKKLGYYLANKDFSAASEKILLHPKEINIWGFVFSKAFYDCLLEGDCNKLANKQLTKVNSQLEEIFNRFINRFQDINGKEPISIKEIPEWPLLVSLHSKKSDLKNEQNLNRLKAHLADLKNEILKNPLFCTHEKKGPSDPVILPTKRAV